MPTGRVKWYRRDMGLGFITPDTGGEDVLFRRAALVGDDTTVGSGIPVAYDAVPGLLGEGPIATHVAVR